MRNMSNINKPVYKSGILLVFALFVGALIAHAQSHPKLILTKEGVEAIRAHLGSVPIFDQSLKEVQQEVDAEIALGIDVPIPKDMAGGYTHERHKRNFLILQKAGVLFQILEDEKYAVYIRDMFQQYAHMYKDLPLHPTNRSYAPGKIFWQCLNDANWLVYASQAYDCIYDWLSKKERKALEKDLFRPYADFLSTGSPQFFNRIHNHSTWGNAAVGMLGLVMDDQELVQRGLYGLAEDTIAEGLKDNDGGFIKMPGQSKSGFFANLEYPFSPDGYYTEGPYYQRYAMYPFMLFAEAIHNVKPELQVFAHKDSVLIKAVYALLNLTDQNGHFFPLNDAQKGMSYLSRELVSAVNIGYYFGSQDPKLLSIAELQGRVLLDDTGLLVAQGITDNKAQPFTKQSLELRDGPQGDQGAVGILRAGSENDQINLVMKYSAHGLSHGHFDKLSFSLYDNGREIIQDYGLARFVNIEHKNGGGYLPENTSWAKQTVAHNTLVADQQSHFKGEYEVSSQHHSQGYFFDVTENLKIVSAKESNAYPGIEMHRTMAIMNDSLLEKPLILDVFRVDASQQHQYDLPYYMEGQLLSADFDFESNDSLQPLGGAHGYQHLWCEAQGKASSENINLTWMLGDRFYSITSLTDPVDQILFTRIGANDPEFNLRRDQGIILRKEAAQSTLFASIIEPHGYYSPVSEIPVNSYSSISKIELLHNDHDYTVLSIHHSTGHQWIWCLANDDASKDTQHQVELADGPIKWQGPYLLMRKTKS